MNDLETCWHFDSDLYPILKSNSSFKDLLINPSDEVVGLFNSLLEEEFGRVFSRKKNVMSRNKYSKWLSREARDLIKFRALGNRCKALIKRDKGIYLREIQDRMKWNPTRV